MSSQNWSAGRTRRKGVCLLLCLGIALPVSIAATELERLNQENLHARTVLSAHHIAESVDAQLTKRFKRLSQLASNLQSGQVQTEEAFRRQARALVMAFPDYQAINWIDDKDTIRWVVPLEDNASAVGVHLNTVPLAYPHLKAAQSQRAPRATPLLELIQGGFGFATYFPVTGGPVGGTVNGAFRIQPLLQSILPIELRKEVRVQFVNPQHPAPTRNSPPQTEVAIGILGQALTLVISPNKENDTSNVSPTILLIFGLIVAFTTGILAYQLLESRASLISEETHRRALFTAVTDHVVLLGPDHRTLAYHPSPHEPHHLQCHLPPEQWMPAILQSSVEQAGVEAKIIETEVVVDGRHYEVRIAPDCEHHTVMSLRDVTDRIETEAQKILLARLVASSAHLAAVIGSDGRLEYLNPAGREILALGFTPKRLDNILDLTEDILSPLEAGRSWAGRLHLRSARDQYIPVHLTSFSIPTAWGPKLGLIAIDLRKTVELEKQLEQAHKMEALGTLAAGIAHDFNNAVTVFKTGVELLGNTPNLPPDTFEDLSLLRSAATGAAHIARQLLTFARPRRGMHRTFLLDDMLANSALMFTKALREDIELSWSLEAENCTLLGDPEALQQAILNLVINARDAMSSTGCVRISSSYANPDMPNVVSLSVEDNGSGISKDLQQKVFEPFFTTKPTGHGSGLGLAMVRRVVEAYGGSVHLYSQLGEGTRVQLILPIQAESSNSDDIDRNEYEPINRPLRILLVEDDPSLRSIMQRGLQQLGHEVNVAEDGIGALELLSSDADVLLVDMVMPRMGGIELARHVRREHPNIRIVLMTGHPDVTADKTLPDKVELIFKPTDTSTILKHILRHSPETQYS